MPSGAPRRQRQAPSQRLLLLPHRACRKFSRALVAWSVPPRGLVNSSGKPVPVWDNILLRTALYYLALAVLLYWIDGVSVGGLGTLEGTDAFATVASKKDMLTAAVNASRPAAFPTFLAMLSAFVFALPVAWIYVLTRQKKGFSQSVVQALIVLPLVIAGVVVLVKHSLALAFSLGGIVAAVRFRTNLDDTKDAAAIFCVTGIGLAAGVEPSVAAVLSLGFNLLAVGLWATEFGRAPASLEGRRAQKQLERALTVASRTGTFVAKIDNEVLKSLAPEQLEALADRAWKRKKKMSSEAEAIPRHDFTHLLRVHCRDLETTRSLIEREFAGLFKHWKYMGAERADDGGGGRCAEYGVDLADTVTPGVVNDTLRSISGVDIERVEVR